ncbi:hypothetical protein ADUPG1_009065, partial [Aduncisulcus paluster]
MVDTPLKIIDIPPSKDRTKRFLAGEKHHSDLKKIHKMTFQGFKSFKPTKQQCSAVFETRCQSAPPLEPFSRSRSYSPILIDDSPMGSYYRETFTPPVDVIQEEMSSGFLCALSAVPSLTKEERVPNLKGAMVDAITPFQFQRIPTALKKVRAGLRPTRRQLYILSEGKIKLVKRRIECKKVKPDPYSSRSQPIISVKPVASRSPYMSQPASSPLSQPLPGSRSPLALSFSMDSHVDLTDTYVSQPRSLFVSPSLSLGSSSLLSPQSFCGKGSSHGASMHHTSFGGRPFRSYSAATPTPSQLFAPISQDMTQDEDEEVGTISGIAQLLGVESRRFSGSPSVRDDVDGVCSTAVEREKELNELEKQLKYVHEHSEWRPDPKYRHVNTVGLFSALKHALDNPLIDSRTLKQKKLSSQTHTLGTKRMRGKPRHHLSKTVAFPPMSSSGSCDDEFQGVSTKPRIVCADMVKTLRGCEVKRMSVPRCISLSEHDKPGEWRKES